MDELIILRQLGMPWSELSELYGVPEKQIKRYLDQYLLEQFFPGFEGSEEL